MPLGQAGLVQDLECAVEVGDGGGEALLGHAVGALALPVGRLGFGVVNTPSEVAAFFPAGVFRPRHQHRTGVVGGDGRMPLMSFAVNECDVFHGRFAGAEPAKVNVALGLPRAGDASSGLGKRRRARGCGS